jgi:serine/threonine protein kinase
MIGEKYIVEQRLAEGGMGTLYVARHELTEQRVALKVLKHRLARDEEAIERFLREVRMPARIGHPGVVRVHDAGVDVTPDGDPVPFLAMELLVGETLAESLARGNVPQSEALDRLLETLDPLAAAHALGVVHRDLKPENIFLERGDDGAERVKLIDFGIARDTADERHATAAGQTLGTVYYMAPEQCIDARVATAASDVWSFGAIIYQCLAGEFPFDGESIGAVMVAVCRDAHVPLATRRPDLDPRLGELVDRCLRKSPDARPADAEALYAELAPLLGDPAIRAALEARPVVPDTFLPDEPTPAVEAAEAAVPAPSPEALREAFATAPAPLAALVRSASPGRSNAPNRSASPGRSHAPNRSASPGRSNAPNRSASPGRSHAPNRSASPGRSTAPDGSIAPGGSTAPDEAPAPEVRSAATRWTLVAVACVAVLAIALLRLRSSSPPPRGTPSPLVIRGTSEPSVPAPEAVRPTLIAAPSEPAPAPAIAPAVDRPSPAPLPARNRRTNAANSVSAANAANLAPAAPTVAARPPEPSPPAAQPPPTAPPPAAAPPPIAAAPPPPPVHALPSAPPPARAVTAPAPPPAPDFVTF